jgi:hypothetical protein
MTNTVDDDVSRVLDWHGMESVLNALADSIPDTDETYLIRLRLDLDTALRNYRNRYEGGHDDEGSD